MPKHPGGAPTKMTPEVLQELKDAFLLGCTDEEACYAADISTSSLYNYQNEHPEFLDKKNKWKKRPVYLARKCVVDNVSGDKDLALKFLERKNKKEFSLRQENINADVTKEEFEKMTDEQLKEEAERLISDMGYVKKEG
jgi:hypothetical protein